MEYLTLTGHMEGKSDRGTGRINYLTRFCKMEDTTGFRKYSIKTNFSQTYKGEGIVETHDRQYPDGVYHTEEE